MKYCFWGFLLLAIVSCQKNSLTTRAKTEQLAGRINHAVAIRQLRFALADTIRFTQDSMKEIADKTGRALLQKKLQIYLREKGELLRLSLALADTIHLQLDSLMPYADKLARKHFYASLDSILAKKAGKPN
jgi:hypothetical protein